MSFIIFHSRPNCAQRGFSLVEVSIVTAIVLLIAIIGIPAIGSYVIENKVPRVAEELQRFVARVKINAQGAGPTPYVGLDTAALANALKDSSVISVTGQGSAAVVVHGLGGNGTAGNGTISVAPAAVAAGGAGSGFTLRLTNVSNAACPSLASVLQRVSEIILLEGVAGAVLVKDATAIPPLAYSAAAAEVQCAPGDRNTFVFTAR
jgi:type IV pilus assembly protein PilA